NQVQYEFSSAGKLTRIHEPAGNQLLLGYVNGKLATITDTAGRVTTLGYNTGHNVAQGKSYTKSVAADPTYPDTSGVELTDGTIANALDFHDGGWQGHYNLGAPLDVTIDLGASQSVGVFRSFYMDRPGDGIYKPATVEIQTSPDNITYASRGS